jgi:saccharopine dehydrogenase-like NADP-dependent oxidoreductase
MNILVLGGGATGSVAACALAESKKIKKVILGDISDKSAKKFLIPHPKVDFRIIDATKRGDVLKALENCAALVNAASPAFNTMLLETALHAGVNYQDFASDWEDAVVEQFEYDDQFKARGLVGLINASATPGVSNLLVGELSAKFSEIDYIKIRLLEDVSADVPLTAWSKEVAFDEFISPPFLWDGQKFEKTGNFAEEEIFDFPEPFMDQKCYMVAQEDIGTIPRYIKAKRIDIKAGGSEIDFARSFYLLGLTSKIPIQIGSDKISPYDFMLKVWPNVPSLAEMRDLVERKKVHNAHFWAAVDVHGTSIADGKKITLRADILFPSQTEINKIYPGANYVSYAAGLCAAIFAENISSLPQKGVYSPEAIGATERASIIRQLKKNGVKIVMRKIKDKSDVTKVAPHI